MALGTILPFWPALLFTYIEVIALVLGWHSAYFTPSDFTSRQLPATTTTAVTPVPKSAEVLALTLANIYLLLGGIAILCTVITRDARVVKGYLFIIGLGDLGHIYASYQVMGPSMFWDFANYNDMMWGNIGFSAFLHINRIATLLGLFGRVGRRA